MNPMAFFEMPVWHHVALCLGHFLWQGALLAVVGYACAHVLGRRSARTRYGLYVTCLLAMLVAPIATYGMLFGESVSPPAPPMAPDIVSPEVSPAPATPMGQPAVRAVVPSPMIESQPATVVAEPVAQRFDWSRCVPYAMGLYCLGVILLMVRLLWAVCGGKRLARLSSPVNDAAILEVLATQAQALKLKVIPAIAFCARIAVPTVVGVIRPTILLPLAFANNLSPEQIEMILTHELAHIRRWDPLVNILQRLIEAVLFFHPAVWIISHRVRVEREHCCDDLVVKGGTGAEAYASSLLQMAQQAVQHSVAVEGVTAVSKRSSRLGLRIRRILGLGQPEEMRLQHPWAMTLALVAIVVLLFGAVFPGQDTTAEAASETKARVSMIASDDEAPERSYRWGVSRDMPLKVIQGWFTYDAEGIKEHGGGGRDVAEADPTQLTLTVTKEGDRLVLHRGTVRRHDTDTLTADAGNRTAWPVGATLRTHFLSESAELTAALQPLWKGQWVLEGKVVKTLVYAARVVGPNEPIHLFDVQATEEALRISRAWGPEPDPSKQVYDGRTITQWMAQWDTRNYPKMQEATNKLKEIGGPAVPAMLDVLKGNGKHAGYASRVLGGMGPAAEPAMGWLMATALDKRNRDPKDRQRVYAMVCLTDMTWAANRLLPVFEAVALDATDDESIRRTALSGLGKIGLPARAVVQKVIETASGTLKGTAHRILVTMLTEAGLTTKAAYYTEVIEQDPFDATVPSLLTSSKGTVNQGKPHALTQRIKQRIRARLAQDSDPQLSMNLARIIQDGLRATGLLWAAPTDGSRSRWNREDPTESFHTLRETLELGLTHAEPGSDLHTEFAVALAKQALMAGDWDRMNAMLQRLGQRPVPRKDCVFLCAPPIDWKTDLASQWIPCDESMRDGDCSLEFRIEKQGRPLAGAHILVKKVPDPSRAFYSGIPSDTLFLGPYPLGTDGDSFGYRANDRQHTRYAVTDATGRVRFDKLPEIPIKIEVLIPTGNFREPGSSWDLWMEVEPGQFKMAKAYGGPDTVSPREAPAVVTLKPGQTVHYPKLVVRPAFALNVADWDSVDKDNFVLAWHGMDESFIAEQGIQYELDMHLCTPSQSPDRAEDKNPIVKTVQRRLTENQWPVGAEGIGGMQLHPGNIYMFEVRAVDSQGTVVARWPKTRVWIPWTHRKSSVPVTRDMDRMGPPIYNKVWHRGTFGYGDGNEETLRQKVARLIEETPDAFEWEYLRLGKAWLDWDDGRVDAAKEQLTRLKIALPRGNLVRGTAVALLEQIKNGDKAPRRLEFVPDEPEPAKETPDIKDTPGEAPMSPAPGVNVYFLKDESLTWDDCRNKPLNELDLRPEPWIKAADILRYDTFSHCMTLTRIRPLPFERPSLRGNPFVVCVGDSRCYLGAVWTGFSSYLPEGTTPIINMPSFSHPPNVIGIELPRVHSHDEGSVSSLDVRRDPRVLAALKAQGVAHAGLSMDLGPFKIASDGQQSSVTYSYTLTNHDTDSLYVLDPEKMGTALFHYFHNPPFFLNTQVWRRIEAKTSVTLDRDLYKQYRKEWFTLIEPGASLARSVTAVGYPVIEPGAYEYGFGFRGAGPGFTEEKRAQFDAPVWIGHVFIKDPVTVRDKDITKSAEPLVWITILPNSPIASMRDYEHRYMTSPSPKAPLYKPVPWPACDFEMRTADNKQRVTRMPYADSFRSSQLTDSAVRRIGDLPHGDYVVALVMGDQRCSNVAQVTIGPVRDPGRVDLVPLPPAPGQSPSVIGIRATGPDPQDPDLTHMDVAFPKLLVDGIERQLAEMKWVGPVGPLQSGRVYARLLDLSRYTPTIEPGGHTITAGVKQYKSEPVVIPTQDNLGHDWDGATASLTQWIAPVPVLKGQVTSLDGESGLGYEVHLTQMDGIRVREQAGAQGHYAIDSIPSGSYTLICNTGGGRARPELTIEAVQIENGSTKTLDISLETKYRVRGKVTYDDGSAAQGVDVTLVSQDAGGRSRFDDFISTDTEGEYRLATAFSQVSYIGVNGRRIKASTPTLTQGTTQLNFVLKKNARGSYDTFLAE